ncbi:MAG: glutamate-1-semialdehyde 2,1-aminomutase [Draconibacterium sp.]
MRREKSEIFFKKAQKSIPGGVNSPVRTFAGVGGIPTFIKNAGGSILTDVDGNSYVDYIGSWGPMIFGHAWQPVVEAVKKQLENSSSYGLATEKEIQLAELIISMVPGIEKVRLVNSGTEACMTAVRIARAATGREKIIKFNGCYHGHADTFLVSAGSGALTLGKLSSPGVSKEVAQNTLIAEYNDLASVEHVLVENKSSVAAIIVEPVAGNMGCIPPEEGFLKGLRKLANEHGAILIFDEVMTGFRLAAGGAQQIFDVHADLVTYGKIIGGGFPVGAVAGPTVLMNLLAPAGPVYQAGTLSGNPVATTAGITVLQELKEHPDVYKTLDTKGEKLQSGIAEIFNNCEIPAQINRVGSMISVFISKEKIKTFNDIKNADMELFSAFFHQMLENGIHLPPSGYESWFLATSLTDELIEKTIEATEKSVQQIKIEIT